MKSSKGSGLFHNTENFEVATGVKKHFFHYCNYKVEDLVRYTIHGLGYNNKGKDTTVERH